MTPREKAEIIVSKYYMICQEFTEEIQCSVQAKQCALIAVNEIISSHMIDGIIDYDVYIYWESVIEEIEKL